MQPVSTHWAWSWQGLTMPCSNPLEGVGGCSITYDTVIAIVLRYSVCCACLEAVLRFQPFTVLSAVKQPTQTGAWTYIVIPVDWRWKSGSLAHKPTVECLDLMMLTMKTCTRCAHCKVREKGGGRGGRASQGAKHLHTQIAGQRVRSSLRP